MCDNRWIVQVGANMKPTGASDILDLVEYLSRAERPCTLSSAATDTGLAKSSCLRLLNILVTKKYVRRSENGRYSLLSAVGVGGMTQKQIDLANLAEPILRQVADDSGVSAFLAVVNPAEKLRYIVKVLPSNQELVYDRDIAKIRELHQVTSGLCILAYRNSDSTANHTELATIRKRGYAVNLHGIIEGASGAAAPVFDRTGQVVAAFNLAGPRHNFEQSLEKITQLTVEGAKALSLALAKR